MSFFALLLLFQSAATPPPQDAPDALDAPDATADVAEPAQEPGGLLRGPGAKQDGRRGNDLYREEAYADAAAAYAGGIATLSDDAGPHVRYGLHNNLGAALLKAGNAEPAREAFEQALMEARETGEATDLARSAYNAGNAAFAAEDLENALAHYRRSLLRNPDNEDARFNYEFVKRQLEQQEQQEQQQQQQQDQEQEEEQDQEQEQDQQESNDENSENDQNEPQQDENEENTPQDEQNNQDEQNDQDEQNEQNPPEEQPGDNEPQPDESPQEQTQEPQNLPSGEQPLSEAQAERILEALEQEEGNLLRELQRTPTRPHRVEKDW